eukprot:SAG31_NODE_1265_length_9070_cov_5.167205_8_plen_138_part_00
MSKFSTVPVLEYRAGTAAHEVHPRCGSRSAEVLQFIGEALEGGTRSRNSKLSVRTGKHITEAKLISEVPCGHVLSLVMRSIRLVSWVLSRMAVPGVLGTSAGPYGRTRGTGYRYRLDTKFSTSKYRFNSLGRQVLAV